MIPFEGPLKIALEKAFRLVQEAYDLILREDYETLAIRFKSQHPPQDLELAVKEYPAVFIEAPPSYFSSYEFNIDQFYFREGKLPCNIIGHGILDLAVAACDHRVKDLQS